MQTSSLLYQLFVTTCDDKLRGLIGMFAPSFLAFQTVTLVDCGLHGGGIVHELLQSSIQIPSARGWGGRQKRHLIDLLPPRCLLHTNHVVVGLSVCSN